MLLSESAVEALVMLVSGLWLTCVLLLVNLLFLRRRVGRLEREMDAVLTRADHPPLNPIRVTGASTVVGVGVGGDAAR